MLLLKLIKIKLLFFFNFKQDESDEKRCGEEDFVDCGDNTKVHNSLRCDDWPDCIKTHQDEINCNY